MVVEGRRCKHRWQGDPLFHAVIIIDNVVAVGSVVVINHSQIPDEVVPPEHSHPLPEPVQTCKDALSYERWLTTAMIA